MAALARGGRVAGVFAAGFLFAVGLGGCYSATDYAPAATPTDTAASGRSAAEGFAIGDDLPQHIAAELRVDIRSDDRAYEMLDGTFVLTNRYTPLPDAVRDDLLERIELTEGAYDGIAEMRDLDTAMTATEKNVLPVRQSCMGPDGGNAECFWFAPSAMSDTAATVEEAVAATEAWVAAQATPELYEVLVTPTVSRVVTPG